MPISLTREAIRDELKYDPHGMGYHAVLAQDSSPDEAIYAMMNDTTRGQPKAIPYEASLAGIWNDLPGAVGSSFYNKWIDQSFRYVQPDANLLFDAATRNVGGVDWGGDKAQTIVQGLFAKGKLTQAEYDAFVDLTHQPASRADNLFGRSVPLADSPDSIRGAIWNDDGTRWDWTA